MNLFKSERKFDKTSLLNNLIYEKVTAPELLEDF